MTFCLAFGPYLILVQTKDLDSETVSQEAKSGKYDRTITIFDLRTLMKSF